MFDKIIVLGMDNTGKTTLCKELARILGYRHVNSLGPKASYSEMSQFIRKNLESEEPMILERFCFFEEMVYGNVLRGKSKFDWADDHYQKIKEAMPLIVYCRPSKAKILQFGEREQMEGVIEQGEKLLSAFDDLYFSLEGKKLFAIPYSFETSTAEQLAHKINAWKGATK